MADGQEKTEEATPKKRRDARKKGNVFSSKDVTTLVSLMVMFALLRGLFPMMSKRMMTVESHFQDLAASWTVLSESGMRNILVYCIITGVVVVAPLILASAVIGVLATGVQTRFMFSYESMRPKLERINPISGFKKMFSLRSIVELIKNILKVTIITVLVYMYIKGHLVAFARLPEMGVVAAIVYTLKEIFKMCMEICIAFAIIAGADFMYQRWDYNKNLKMTKQEVKDEYKQTEGDPQIKGRIRELQRRMASSRMMQQVPEADVIIRNPTHYAIAMKYDAERDVAPRIIAKGADELAMRIVKIGEQSGVYIKEDPELTRAIYAVADIGDVIPYEFYNAVADLLALVYRMKDSAI